MSVSKESFSIASGPIPVDVYSPASSGKHAAVLILHGTLELKPPFGAGIVSFAEALNKKGIAAAIPRYFKSTKTNAGDEALKGIFVHLPAWKTACGGALAVLAADARFDATRMGLLGFSLGGHIALSLAMEQPPGTNIRAVVDFFAPTLEPALNGKWSALPPVLIHHGTADPLTIENSRHLVRKLEAAGRTVSSLTFGKPARESVTGDEFIHALVAARPLEQRRTSGGIEHFVRGPWCAYSGDGDRHSGIAPISIPEQKRSACGRMVCSSSSFSSVFSGACPTLTCGAR